MTEGTITAWKKKEGKRNRWYYVIKKDHASPIWMVVLFLSKESKSQRRGGFICSFRDTDIIVVVLFRQLLIGDSVVAGDVLLEIETDKAGMDVEAIEDGILAKILASLLSTSLSLSLACFNRGFFFVRNGKTGNTLLFNALIFAFPTRPGLKRTLLFRKNCRGEKPVALRSNPSVFV